MDTQKIWILAILQITQNMFVNESVIISIQYLSRNVSGPTARWMCREHTLDGFVDNIVEDVR